MIFYRYITLVLYSCKYNIGISNINIYPSEGKSNVKIKAQFVLEMYVFRLKYVWGLIFSLVQLMNCSFMTVWRVDIGPLLLKCFSGEVDS